MTPERKAQFESRIRYMRDHFPDNPGKYPGSMLTVAELEEYLALLDERAKREAHTANQLAMLDALSNVGAPDEAPFVCPGCYAVGPERCLPGCIDAEIEEERRTDFSTSTDPPDEADEENDKENNVS